jgi:hypothetical protein
MYFPIALSILLALVPPAAEKRRGPSWWSQEQNPQLWSRVKDALATELQPDDPSQVAPHTIALRYKYVVRAASIDNVALVLIGMRESRRLPTRSNLFAAYSVDLTSGAKESVGKFVLWRFVKWARFDSDPASDAVFSFQSCDECEAETYLASFAFDPRRRVWKVREWPDNGKQVRVGADPEPDSEVYTRCLYDVKDHTRDGFDDLAVSCRTIDVKTQKTRGETVTLHVGSSSGLTRNTLSSQAAQRIHLELCRQSARSAQCK